ncbi:MAG: hypothetical protein ACREP9_07505 [Candidatus Dormibacteraceae bacterium]
MACPHLNPGRLTRSLALSALACALSLSGSPASDEGPGWIYDITVVNIVDTASGGINVRVSPDLTSCTSQGGYGPHFASIGPTHPAINRIKATLLTAYLSGMPVSLYLVDNTCTVAEVILGTT